jgi:hypothetical protein
MAAAEWSPNCTPQGFELDRLQLPCGRAHEQDPMSEFHSRSGFSSTKHFEARTILRSC